MDQRAYHEACIPLAYALMVKLSYNKKSGLRRDLMGLLKKKIEALRFEMETKIQAIHSADRLNELFLQTLDIKRIGELGT